MNSLPSQFSSPYRSFESLNNTRSLDEVILLINNPSIDDEYIFEKMEQTSDLYRNDYCDESTIFHVACKSKRLKIMEKLIKEGCFPELEDLLDLISSHDPKARDKNYLSLLEEILKKHPTIVAAHNMYSGTILHVAAFGGKVDIIELLLGYGAEVNAFDAQRCTPLHSAAMHDNLEAIELLLKNGANVNVLGYEGKSLLHFAVLGYKLELIELLIKYGADVNALDSKRCTPLHSAAMHDNLEAIELLLKNGANVNVFDYKGKSPLHFAVLGYKLELIELLIKYGADVNALDSKRCTPLHSAALGDKLEFMELLIKHGASATVLDDENKSPFEFAVSTKGLKIMKGSIGSVFNLEQKNLDRFRFAFVGHSDPMSVLFSRDNIDSVDGLPYASVAAMFSQLCKEFKEEVIKEESFSDAIGFAYEDLLGDTESKLSEIQKGAIPVFVPVKCFHHAIYLGFFKTNENEYYVCVIDRGQSPGNGHRLVSVYKYDPGMLSLELLEKVQNDLFSEKQSFMQKEFPRLIGCKKDAFCEQIEKFIDERKAFPAQKRGNCSIADAKPLYFFAKVFENPKSLHIEKSFISSKRFFKFCRQTVESRTPLLEPFPEAIAFMDTSNSITALLSNMMESLQKKED